MPEIKDYQSTDNVAEGLAVALRRVLDWPLPDGSVKTYALPGWLWDIGEAAIAKYIGDE